MRILGIDPGSVQTGFGIIEEKDGALVFLDCGVIRTSGTLPISYRLKRLYHGLNRIIESKRPDVVSLENIFIARNVSSAFKLGHARGAAILAAVNYGLEVFDYTPAEVKKAVAGFGRADKEQVQKMVKSLLALPYLPDPYDASDALAIAICHSQSRMMRRNLKAVTLKNQNERCRHGRDLPKE
ncbi:MAG: crossover junction endodeoxyribonuclease RuvC [Nitrospirae bacterium CG_4_9_14_3_um_filter_53_35]|nr:MAG: crossover junction endodeoxyribonuclease RuvC [Nitrospirae bacterium CG2_30_53_67]PIS36377.1 MAG: crossover junction endodeoxyribonuclease RuvC [Nitrospirae bacterium CG08_land_8_20_14_0_20_52_24]PIV85065.1 MAG: crossover junction endodeoxyribonuclease RuvC [Nitrospirae bacterium CG17_big_fil_post_rev_8_21_14_2_50_50_9]PIX85864.1 MAG: crossover junction endodeoxyribonuclease RuvC [Nitrospirae bacterium CG_4_10_14_3_um_filter_53_41]PJA72712.1 MAG: crossover junction endodeoxyribonuclease